MRKTSKLLALLMICTLLLISLAGQSLAASSADKKGGYVEELRIGTTKPNDVFSSSSESGAFGQMNYNAFTQATFTDLDENYRVKPNFMQSWEISDDYKTLTFTFPENVYWHDGKPVTAEDVKFTFEYLRDVRKSSYITRFNLTNVEILDTNKIRLTFEDSSAWAFINRIAFVVYVYPEHIWGKIDDPTKYAGEDAVIGCGPYKYVSYDPDSQTSYYTAVDSYYREITVKNVSVRSFDNQESLLMALKSGQIDATYDYANPLDATLAPAFTDVPNIDPGKSYNTGSFFMSFGFNKYPTNDLEFRKAVSYALDYELLRRVIAGEYGEVPSRGMIAPPNKGHDPTIEKLKTDLDEANKILEQAGFKDINGDGIRELPDGKPMDILITPSNNIARQPLFVRISEVVSENLKKVGIKTTIDMESVRNRDFFRKRTTQDGDYDLFIHFSTPGNARLDTVAWYFLPKPDGFWGTYTDEEYLAAFKKIRVAKGNDEYDENVKILQKMLAERILGVSLCWDMAFFPYRTDKYEGWTNYSAWGVINNETWYTLRTK